VLSLEGTTGATVKECLDLRRDLPHSTNVEVILTAILVGSWLSTTCYVHQLPWIGANACVEKII
jgi:hypothetical protein